MATISKESQSSRGGDRDIRNALYDKDSNYDSLLMPHEFNKK